MLEISRKNNLDKASSAYLTSAKHQPVYWQEWGETLFEAAQRLDLPILLDIGAVWCHWCHVMDRESYENEQIAEIINAHFIPVKVDRDERPDVDRRFQTFVQALGGGGGWPLTCFLTPEGKFFYGGTYFPPEDKMGRPGMRNLLLNISRTYREKRNEVFASASILFDQIAEFEKTRSKKGELNPDIIAKILIDLENNFDPVYGGFGTSQKFPNGSAIELALLGHAINQDKKYLDIAQITLDNIAAGGIHDHIGGGFHRYSVDQFWHVPHFEKMTSDNADFLINFLHLYHVTGNDRYKRIAEGIIGYYRRDMSDNTNGGFYAHQDADISLEDDGDYFTWTKKEIEEHLNPEQTRVFSGYFGITETPHDLHETPDRNVLFRVRKLDKIAEEFQIPLRETESLLESAQSKLLKVRYTRQAPYIDKTIFANINGMMISAFAEAYKILKQDELKLFSIKTTNFILNNLYSPEEGFSHSYVNGKASIKNLLSDQVWMALALMNCFEISGGLHYLEKAQEVVGIILGKYQDAEKGGFFDRIPGRSKSEVLSIGHKPFEDVPVASSNSIAVRVLDSLYALTGDEHYREAAEKALRSFAGSLGRNGTYVASYAMGLFNHMCPPPLVIIISNEAHDKAAQLQTAAHSIYRPGKQVYVFDAGTPAINRLPGVVKTKIGRIPINGSAIAFVCSGMTCAPPTDDPDELIHYIKIGGRPEADPPLADNAIREQ